MRDLVEVCRIEFTELAVTTRLAMLGLLCLIVTDVQAADAESKVEGEYRSSLYDFEVNLPNQPLRQLWRETVERKDILRRSFGFGSEGNERLRQFERTARNEEQQALIVSACEDALGTNPVDWDTLAVGLGAATRGTFGPRIVTVAKRVLESDKPAILSLSQELAMIRAMNTLGNQGTKKCAKYLAGCVRPEFWSDEPFASEGIYSGTPDARFNLCMHAVCALRYSPPDLSIPVLKTLARKHPMPSDPEGFHNCQLAWTIASTLEDAERLAKGLPETPKAIP